MDPVILIVVVAVVVIVIANKINKQGLRMNLFVN